MLDWLKTRKRLLAERDYAWGALDALKDAVAAAPSLFMKHWAAAALAKCFADTLRDANAPNYVSMTFHPAEGPPLEVLVQNLTGETPAHQAGRYREENTRLRGLLREALHHLEDPSQYFGGEHDEEFPVRVRAALGLDD